MSGSFENVAAVPGCRNWDRLIHREKELYGRADDIRSPFGRDYTRVLHSLAFRRLKHKTQVFFNAGDNDHVCTRMEHVLHVESVSSTIASFLGLNTELTKVISMAHDLGHAPFGHQGEKVLKSLSEEYLGTGFWHEKNGLYICDNIELLEDNEMNLQGLDLTYAVRDGIISHCGEVDSNAIVPRDDLFDLEEFDSPGKYEAATWEGCVVKFSDKIAYLGRDLEDARMMGILQIGQIKELEKIAGIRNETVNTTVIMHNAIIDLCRHSSPKDGLRLSDDVYRQISEIKKFNYENIYLSPKLIEINKKAEENLKVLFLGLEKLYSGSETIRDLVKDHKGNKVLEDFAVFLSMYCDQEAVKGTGLGPLAERCLNRKVYGNLETRSVYRAAVRDFIAGMTDVYAENACKEIICSES
ncbi:MAG: HD domain-containing protein [Lachnospiraceae bacterium]|nr:HD domain-containing protein [Lachnospiraceae bacterium]